MKPKSIVLVFVFVFGVYKMSEYCVILLLTIPSLRDFFFIGIKMQELRSHSLDALIHLFAIIIASIVGLDVLKKFKSEFNLILIPVSFSVGAIWQIILTYVYILVYDKNPPLFIGVNIDTLREGYAVAWMAILSMCVLAPISEEFVSRGIVIDRLRNIHGLWVPAMAIVPWAMLHANDGGIERVLITLPSGIVYYSVRRLTGHFGYAVLAHSASNLVILLWPHTL